MEPTLKQFDRSATEVLHLELTTRCNAACPQCARMDLAMGYTSDHDLTLAQCQAMFTTGFVKQLKKMFACGNFGDPAVARDCLAIYHWFRETNPDITLGMNTNGGVRTRVWWQELADIMRNPLDYVVFSIDGLEDTNHLYRKNVNWNTVMSNAEYFIAAGGVAHWDMLVFEHNQHQVDQCRELARNMGFRHFRTKISNRFNERPILDLRPPKDHESATVSTQIDCHALRERSIYVAATGEILPCCFIGSEVFRMDKTMRDFVQQAGYTGLVESWSNNPHPVCTKFCGTTTTGTRFESQFREETALC